MSTEVRGHCRSVAPIMPTTDIEHSRTHYERMGFVVELYGDFVMTRRDGVELFLSLKPDHDPKTTASCVYVRVDDADTLYTEWSAAGPPGLREPRNTDYRMREFAYIDPDGNLLLFGSPLST